MILINAIFMIVLKNKEEIFCLNWLTELRSLNEEGKEFHSKEGVRVAEDLEKGGFRFDGWEERKFLNF